MKILIVDDNKELTYLFSRVLESTGHKCTVSNDGRSGLDLLYEQTFDAAVLDIDMPNFSGFEIIDALEKQGKLKQQKIVVLTATSIPDERLQVLKRRGIHACLKKPISPDSLLEILEKPVSIYE